MLENEYQSRMKHHKEKVMRVINQRQLYSVMNNTKWKELQSAIDTLPFPPPYQIKYVLKETPHPKTFGEDAWYWGDWSDEVLTPFYAVEWICVRPRYTRHRGMLINDELIDETQEFISVLQKASIPYEEENGAYYIYGYKSNKS